MLTFMKSRDAIVLGARSTGDLNTETQKRWTTIETGSLIIENKGGQDSKGVVNLNKQRDSINQILGFICK